MSFFDRLALLAAGAAKGYRGSEQLQRELAEAKRKALFEEREQDLRERETVSLGSLRSAQTEDVLANAAKSKFDLSEAERASQRGQTRIRPEGQTLDLDVMGNRLSLPGTLEDVSDPNISALMREMLEGQSSIKRESLISSRERAGRLPKTPKERLSGYLNSAFLNPGLIGILESDKFLDIIDKLMEIPKRYDPEAFNTTSESTQTPKRNRFKRTGIK